MGQSIAADCQWQRAVNPALCIIAACLTFTHVCSCAAKKDKRRCVDGSLCQGGLWAGTCMCSMRAGHAQLQAFSAAQLMRCCLQRGPRRGRADNR